MVAPLTNDILEIFWIFSKRPYMVFGFGTFGSDEGSDPREIELLGNLVRRFGEDGCN